MSSSTATVLSALIGLLVGHVLTRRWQFEQWKLENRKAEYRQLLSALSAGYMATVSYRQWSTTEGREEVAKVQMAATACIKDRIFIAEEMRRNNILLRWETSLHRYRNGAGDDSAFQEEFSQITNDLVNTALKAFNSSALDENDYPD